MAITSDKLTWIYTTYGLGRLAEVKNNPSDKLQLYKIKVGDSNGTYYVPIQDAENLVHYIPDGEFYVHEKGILDDGVTVWFKTLIPESSSGYEISEVGLFETINGVDKLFAISTSQPIVKPNIDDNYILSIEYTLNIKSVNLSAVYAQIFLDANNEYVKQVDFNELSSTVLYVESNLMEQISKESHIVGLDRPTQLLSLIDNNMLQSSNSAVALSYSNVLGCTTSESMSSYWVFNYSKYLNGDTSVVDLSTSNNHLALSKRLNAFDRGYTGLAPYLNISDNNYFKLDKSIGMDLLKTGDFGLRVDTPVSLIFVLEHNDMNSKSTLLAKSDYSADKNVFEINKTSANEIEFKMFSDSSSYLTFTSQVNSVPSGVYCLIVNYNGDKFNPQVSMYLNFNKLYVTKVQTGGYGGMRDTSVDLTSYTTDYLGVLQDNINSKVSVISIIKDSLTESDIKSITLNMLALSGNDTCLIV